MFYRKSQFIQILPIGLKLADPVFQHRVPSIFLGFAGASGRRRVRLNAVSVSTKLPTDRVPEKISV